MGATELWLVRHGESTANVAADHAEREGLETIEVAERDADVPLSQLGVQQARAFGRWLGEAEHAPDAAWVSPYLRARQTAGTALEVAGEQPPVRIDERLRDRELGILDLLTSRGVEARYPDEAARRRRLGKYYYRPPGGESWADVALRLRSVLHDIDRSNDGQTVLVVAHDAVVMLIVSICLELDEQQLLDFTLVNTVSNASVTTLRRGAQGWELVAFSDDEHLLANSVPVTEHSGDKDAEIH